MPAPQQRLGGNLVLASLLAVLSYVPFEYVAKLSLVVFALLFILDPIPPLTRIISILSLFVVHFLSKIYNKHIQEHQDEVIVEENKKEE